jgi:hypothetical protein
VFWFSTKARLSTLITGFSGLLLLGSVAIAEQPAIGGFQPQGLNYAGIYQLKQTDPTLTGAGVKVPATTIVSKIHNIFSTTKSFSPRVSRRIRPPYARFFLAGTPTHIVSKSAASITKVSCREHRQISMSSGASLSITYFPVWPPMPMFSPPT